MRAILLILFLLLSSYCYAQLGALIRSADEFGIVLGPNSSQIIGSSNWKEGRQIKIGYKAGILTTHCIGKNSSINSGLLFERKGNQRVLDISYYDAEENIQKSGKKKIDNNFSFLTLPLQYRYTIGTKGKFYIEGGGYTSLLLRQVDKTEDLFNGHTRKRGATDDYKKLDYGLSIGTGYRHPLRKNLVLNTEINYSRGISQLQKGSISGVYTNTLSLGLAIIYAHSPKP